MEEMIKIQEALLTYIESLTHYEISRFLQFYPQLVEDAKYFIENTPVSVKDDEDTDRKIEKLLSEIKELLNNHEIE